MRERERDLESTLSFVNVLRRLNTARASRALSFLALDLGTILYGSCFISLCKDPLKIEGPKDHDMIESQID